MPNSLAIKSQGGGNFLSNINHTYIKPNIDKIYINIYIYLKIYNQ